MGGNISLEGDSELCMIGDSKLSASMDAFIALFLIIDVI